MAQNETKLASYHNTPFTKLCLGMTRNGTMNWILVNYTAISLYSVIAGGSYHATNAGQAEWVSLMIIHDALQSNCAEEGFNVQPSKHYIKLRIGIACKKNVPIKCSPCDSVIGFGIKMHGTEWSSGNINSARYQTNKPAFGYIIVQ